MPNELPAPQSFGDFLGAHGLSPEEVAKQSGLPTPQTPSLPQAGAMPKPADVNDQFGGNVEIPSDADLYNEIDPDTGRRYILPTTNTLDPHYADTYIAVMRLKYTNPEAFKNALNGD